MKPTWMFLFLVGATALVCATPASADAQDPEGRFVSADWLAANLDDPRLVLLEVHFRDLPEEVIPGSVLLPYGAMIQQTEVPVELLPVPDLVEVFSGLGISEESRVVLSGSPLGVGRAYMTLDYLGFGERTWALDGGITAWKATGRDLVAEPRTPTRAPFVPHVQEDILVSAEWIRERLDDPDVTLLDARPLGEYDGSQDQEGLRGGHIPGAYNLFFADLVRGQEDPSLIGMDEIRRRFAESGADQGETIVNYCFIGMRASFTYLMAKHLGYDAKLYDQSWAEWGAREDLPLVEGATRR